MEEYHLNLARKWRSRDFCSIVGQPLVIRILKNSLYKGQFFPVYLFSGQHGCGKTMTARVFTAAVMCAQLKNFQANPKQIDIPCLTCDSCVAMQQGKHPDFVEIDAASHTGVDNVRSIIEASSLLPIMAWKKIYLIDEAHMLSKAAFTAYLKILEEPPSTVLFILATTDPEKIIDTVRSRCLQLFFSAINEDVLVDHLVHIAKNENINVERDALCTIVKETGGSARDALNLLEQVRFSHEHVTQESVLNVLGLLPEKHLLTLLNIIVQGDEEKLLIHLNQIDIKKYDARIIWKKIQECVRMILYAKYAVNNAITVADIESFKEIVTACSIKQLNKFLEILCEHEQLLLKTSSQSVVLEMIFLWMCGAKASCVEIGQKYLQTTNKPVESVQVSSVQNVSLQKTEEIKINTDQIFNIETIAESISDDRWNQFIQKVETIEDQLLTSIFKQGSFVVFDSEKKEIQICFSQEISFFQNWIDDTKTKWQPLLQLIFGEGAILVTEFRSVVKIKSVLTSNSIETVSDLNILTSSNKALDVSIDVVVGELQDSHQSVEKVIKQTVRREKVIQLTDKEEGWELSRSLLKTFGGTLVEIQE